MKALLSRCCVAFAGFKVATVAGCVSVPVSCHTVDEVHQASHAVIANTIHHDSVRGAKKQVPNRLFPGNCLLSPLAGQPPLLFWLQMFPRGPTWDVRSTAYQVVGDREERAGRYQYAKVLRISDGIWKLHVAESRLLLRKSNSLDGQNAAQ